MATVDWLDPDSLDFPPLAAALTEPNGLLAVGGDLRPERLVNAYRHGIFPWYEDPQPLLWWSPDPRAVLIPDQIHVSRSLAKVLRRAEFRVSFDSAFRRVINACATLDQNRTGTWITSDMMNAYIRMFELGWAHSVEVWRDRELVGDDADMAGVDEDPVRRHVTERAAVLGHATRTAARPWASRPGCALARWLEY